MTSEKQTEVEIEEHLAELLLGGDSDLPEVVADVVTFRDAGVLTNERGLVLKLADGSEFQVTIVQSKAPTGDFSSL